MQIIRDVIAFVIQHCVYIKKTRFEIRLFWDVIPYEVLICTVSGLHLKASLSFCTTTFSASLTNVTLLLPQSRDYSCCLSRPILAPPPLWLQKHADLRAHVYLWRQPRLANVTCAWNLRLYWIYPAIHSYRRFKNLAAYIFRMLWRLWQEVPSVVLNHLPIFTQVS